MPFLLSLVIIGAVAYYFYKDRSKPKDESPKTEPSAPKQETQKPKTPSPKAEAPKKASAPKAKPSPVKLAFPYPAKHPGGCRFPGTSEISNFQECGEEPIQLHESEFEEWWFFCEDSDKPCWSYVGTDKAGHCILQRRYRHGSMETGYTFEKRFFTIKRNVMASIFSLALIEGHMDRYDYFQQVEKFDCLFPPTGDPEKDGPEVLLPPQELLDKPSEEEIAAAKREAERQQMYNQVIWDDGVRKLFFAGTTPKLIYKGKEYYFSGHGYEPMTIILDKDGEVAYIHNSFLVEEECREFVKNPKYLCTTITGHKHNAKHFCMLLTTAIDYGYDWQINDLEFKMFSLERFAQREVFYNANGIEFGMYGYEIQDDIDPAEHDDDEPKTHFEYDIMYIIVDGKEYRLEDANMKRVGQLGIFEKDRHKPKIRINGTKGSVIAAYTDDWRSGETFTPFGFPCNTKQFCEMMAYAIRSGKNDFQMEQLKKIVTGEPLESKACETVYEDDKARLWLEDNSARLRYRDKTYSFGYDGREPFATITGSNIYVIIRQGENVDATCRYFLKHPEGTIKTITGRELDIKHFCKLLCTAVAHDHGQDSEMEYYIDELERKAFELEDFRARHAKQKDSPKSDRICIVYNRESVCMADDYVNKSLKIKWSDSATLEYLINYLIKYHEDSGYAAIPFTGGDAQWRIMAGETALAEVNDSGQVLSYCGNNPRATLRELGISEIYGKRV